jgi:nucleoside 2-deoxyribosyltransferase
MLTEIHRAQFVVADVTLQRPGVYFEAGYAIALGKTVIWSCKENDFEKVHFDTRQYPHIVWETPEDLVRQLTEKLAYLVAASKRETK